MSTAKNKLTPDDIACCEKYRRCSPVERGNLHERMKYVIDLLEMNRGQVPIGSDLWNAIYDLETEVSYHSPKIPPCGQRTR